MARGVLHTSVIYLPVVRGIMMASAKGRARAPVLVIFFHRNSWLGCPGIMVVSL